MSFQICFTIPTESAMSKINMDAKAFEHRLPHTCNLFSLRNRIGRHKGCTDCRALHELRRFEIPPGNVVDILSDASHRILQVSFLLSGLIGIPNERRIAHDVVKLHLGNDIFPIHLESISLYDMCVCLQREKVQRHTNNVFRFLHHLALQSRELF